MVDFNQREGNQSEKDLEEVFWLHSRIDSHGNEKQVFREQDWVRNFQMKGISGSQLHAIGSQKS